MAGIPLTAMKIRGVKLVLTLQKGNFPEITGSNEKTIYAASLPGYLHVDINLSRLPALLGGNNSVVTIYGMTTADCFAATKFNYTIESPYYNQIQVYADYINPPVQTDGTFLQSDVITELEKLPLTYMGQIISAGADFNNPDRPFVIQSVVSLQAVSTYVFPSVFNSTTTFSAAVQAMINNYNNSFPTPTIVYQFGSVFPDSVINNGSYTGPFFRQLNQICNDYSYQVRMSLPTNAITPNVQVLTFTQIGSSSEVAPQDLSTETGMIGYPTILPFGVAVKEYFNPRRSINDIINLITYYTPLASTAAGNYYVWNVVSHLQTNDEEWSNTLTLLGINQPG